MIKRAFNGILLIFLFVSCAANENQQETKIIWDDWGVPHIYAQNDEDLYFSAGYAQMHLRGNIILELYGRARSKGAEYWGADYAETDFLVHTMGFSELAAKWTQTQDPELQNLINSFVRGMNAYAEAHPDAFEEKHKVVLPIQNEDVNAHALYVVYTLFVGGNDLGRVQQWVDKGSNAYAVAGKRSASGNAMLVQNPHLPWFGEFLFTEMHFVTPDNNLYGSTLVDFPMIAIGFNEHLGWSHTDNTIDNADTYEVELSGEGYLLDGEEKAFERATRTIKIKGDDGNFTEQEIEVLKTEHGPVVKKGQNKALAIRMVGYDRPNSFLQWAKMGKAKNFDEFESALSMGQIPFWNVMYADREDNIFYLFNGQIPVRSQGDWDYWNRIIPGGKSEDIWTDVHAYEDLPKVKNPTTGWLQNSNDPPWTCTYPLALNPDDFPAYVAPRGMSFRPQRSAEMLNADESITFDELVSYKLSTRVGMADRVLDELFEAIDQYGGEVAQEAKSVLESWDREANPDSKGTLLFTQWASQSRLWSQNAFEEKWSQANALTSPDGLGNPEQAVKTLEEFGEKVSAKVLLSYGNSSRPGSENNGDQLKLFSDQQMRIASLYEEDVLKNKQSMEVLVDGIFVTKE